MIIKYEKSNKLESGQISSKKNIERIKLNPGSIKKNKDLNLNITLPIEKDTYLVFSFSEQDIFIDHGPDRVLYKLP